MLDAPSRKKNGDAPGKIGQPCFATMFPRDVYYFRSDRIKPCPRLTKFGATPESPF
jgi:hypothetical protein